eukprot:5975845-Prymnesium_polylepis.1
MAVDPAPSEGCGSGGGAIARCCNPSVAAGAPPPASTAPWCAAWRAWWASWCRVLGGALSCKPGALSGGTRVDTRPPPTPL